MNTQVTEAPKNKQTAFEFDENAIEFVRKNFRSSFKFRLMLMFRLPMGFLSGMRIKELTENTCKVSVPYKWLNKNPFKSTFWAVLGMAAEMSSGAFLICYTHNQKRSLSTLVTATTAKYSKKAVDLTTFVCNSGLEMKETIRRAIETGEPQEIYCPMTGYNEAGEVVAEFSFTWSMKVRSKK